MKIVALDVVDWRYPTSLNSDGSDAVHKDPDYSCVYVVLRTDDAAVPAGYGLTFTLGRGNEVVVRVGGEGHHVGPGTAEVLGALGRDRTVPDHHGATPREAQRHDVVEGSHGAHPGVVVVRTTSPSSDRWMPHSVLPSKDAQRPARGSVPGVTGLVQGAQPMDG